jgi:hypothetical protein
MRSLSWFTCLLAASAVAATPAPGHHPHKGCLTDSAAASLVEKYVSLFVEIDEGLARAILAPDFIQISDSLNFIDAKNTKLVSLLVIAHEVRS